MPNYTKFNKIIYSTKNCEKKIGCEISFTSEIARDHHVKIFHRQVGNSQ